MAKRRNHRDPYEVFASAYKRALRRRPTEPRPRRKRPIPPERARVEAERCVQRFMKRLNIRSVAPGSPKWISMVDAVEAAFLEDPHILQADADQITRGTVMYRRPPQSTSE